MALSPPLFHLQNIRVTFPTSRKAAQDRSLHVLEIPELTIHENDFFSVIGPSGCGKSTLLSILAGFRQPTEGVAYFAGTPIVAPGIERGVVFQKNSLLPWLNVWENIALPLKIQGVPHKEAQQRSLEWLERFHLAAFAHSALSQLSGGMLQLVTIARALITEPKALLLDEPLGALDALTREQTQSVLMHYYQQTSTTFFLVTHSIEEALLLSNRLVVMSSRPGRVVEIFHPPFREQAIDGITASAIKLTPEFAHWRNTILDCLASSFSPH